MASSRFFLAPYGEISVDGVTFLIDVPANISLSSFSSIPHNSSDHEAYSPPPQHILNSVQSNAHENGAFLGFSIENPNDRILNPIGKLENRKFLSIFRFKPWWSTMWIGSNGSDLQMETQLILLQVPELNSYVLILPLIEGNFRSSIQPDGSTNEVVLCVESGSTKVKASSFTSCAYFHVGKNPYDLMRDAISAVRVHLGTFRLSEEKTPPNIIDGFGWCTWDAFYLTVEPVGVWHGVKSFTDNGFPPKFLIIDDGWQSFNKDQENTFQDLRDMNGVSLPRLYSLKESEKFAKYQTATMLGPDPPHFDQDTHEKMLKEIFERSKEGQNDDSTLTEARPVEYLIEKEGVGRGGLKAFISDLKRKFPCLDDVYMWHALWGTWAGVRPGTTHFDSKLTHVKVSPSLDQTMYDQCVVKMGQDGIGFVDPDQARDFYEAIHSYLADAGVTGVKMDVINTLEFVCEDHGGRVELAKKYFDGLNESLRKNFDGKGLLASMEHNNEFFFLATKQISMGRVGEDFWPEDLSGEGGPMAVFWLQGVHMVHCGYNSLWQCQFIYPDWDMFQSDHVSAEFHAGSRAISGGPVYVSDKVGRHNLELLRKLVLPDGTILRCQHYALPTRDCLFENPLFDGKTLLKIWNLNKCGGVIGIFNCQGAGWSPEEHMIKAHPECYKTISGFISPGDVEWEQKHFTTNFRQNEFFAVFLHKTRNLHLMKASDKMSVTISPSSFEIATISPVYTFNENTKFAAIGLENMLNSGGAVEFVESKSDEKNVVIEMKIKGKGKFLAYSSKIPGRVVLNNEGVEFEWTNDGVVKFDVPWTGRGPSDVRVNIEI